MLGEIDKRLNRLHELHENIRRAELAGNTSALTNLVKDGLAMSCLFLSDMLSDDNVLKFKSDGTARAMLRKLHKEKKLEPFLKIERELLEVTKLEPRVVDELISALSKIGSSMEPVGDWRIHLEEFRDLVCRATKEQAAAARHRPLIRRVFVGGGGAMIALLNAFPPFAIPPEWTPTSITAGVWLIEKALEKEIDEFMSG